MNPATPSADDLQARLERLVGYLADSPDNAVLLADALALAMNLRRHDVATRLATHARERGFGAPSIQAMLCLHYLQHGQPADALQAGRAALAGGASTPAIAYNTACAAFQAGEYDEARTLLQRAFPDPAQSPADVNVLAARCLHHLGEFDEAIARVSASLPPNAPEANAEALGVRALIQCDNGDADLAIADARQALRQVEDQPDALLALGDALKDVGDYPAAEPAYRALLARDSRNGRAWSGLAQLHLANLDLSAADQCAQQAVAFMTNHIGTWHVLGWIHVLLGNAAAARAAFEQSLPLERGFADTHGGLAVADAMEGKSADAERRIRVAEKLDSNSFAVQYAKLLLLQQSGDDEGARSLVQAVLARQAPASTATGMELVERRVRELLKSRTLH